MNKIYKIFAIIFLLLNITDISGQTNLAPTCTVSASTCMTGACNTMNDLNFGTCETQIMWISTGTPPSATPGVEWMQFDWSSAKTLNKFIIHHGQKATRFLNGGTIQSWNGSTWNTVSTFSNLTPACSSTINFPVTTTSRIRITSFQMSGTQLSNPNFREIEIFGPNVNNDATVSFLTNPDICTYNQQIVAKVTNAGKKRLDSFRLYWSVNNVLQSVNYFKSRLLTGIDKTIILNPSFAFNANTNYTIKAWTLLPNGQVDSTPANDEFALTFSFFGNPTPPTTTNYKQCGNGFPTLTAVPNSPADTVLWYTAATGGTLLGMGKKITGPYITSTSTYYAQAMKLGAKVTLINGAATTGVNVTQSNYYGGMMDIRIANSTIVMDSITVRLWYAAPPSDFQLYYKSGTYAGFETNTNAWTLVNKGRARYFLSGGAYYARVPTKSLFLSPNTTYGIYYTVDISGSGAGNSLYTVNPGTQAQNAELTVFAPGTTIIGLFGSTQVLANYRPYMEFMYSKQCSNPSRTPLTVTVKPRPTGADVVKGPVFKGQFKIGDMTSPDVAEVGKMIVYNLLPPTGFTNAGHGTTWVINSIIAKTRFGKIVPATEYSVIPPSNGIPGSVTFTPKSIWLDSFITFSVNYGDLGPHFCDSTIKRTVIVAPAPRPNFITPATICLGDEILFDNTTFNHSGNATYVWHFGNGDSSDNQSPVYTYKTSGIFPVHLIARSFPWGVVRDTTISIEIGEVPDAKFKVNNQCQGIAISFQNQTTIPNGILSYEWDFGDGTNSTSNNPTHLYSKPGAYKVVLTATANGCVSKASKNAHTFARPVPSFNKVSGSCLNSEFTFNNTSTIAIGEFGSVWDFNDGGNKATVKEPKYFFVTAGAKNVKLKVISEFSCADSVTIPLLVKQIPTTNFTYPYSCSRTPTPFTNISTLNGEVLLGYQWDFGDGPGSTVTNPTKSWSTIGPRVVKLKTVLTNGCSTEESKMVNVGVQPLVDFTAEDRCAGSEVPFTNNTSFSQGVITYDWSFGDGNNSTNAAPVHVYGSTVSQTYTVKLKASIAGGCADSISKTITIQPLPTTCSFDINGTLSAAQILPLQFVPTGGATAGITYTWITGDGNSLSSTAAGTAYKYRLHGKYCVTMVARNAAGCECSTTKCVKLTTDVNTAESMNNALSVYPNPNEGVFQVSLDAEFGPEMVVNVYNTLGELIKTVVGIDNAAVVNMSDSASGVYIVKVVSGNRIATKMITLTR
jgi:PKD repeat protein